MWRHSFKSQSTQKSVQLKEFESSQQEAKAEASSSQTDKSDDENESKHNDKISSYLKV